MMIFNLELSYYLDKYGINTCVQLLNQSTNQQINQFTISEFRHFRFLAQSGFCSQYDFLTVRQEWRKNTDGDVFKYLIQGI